jgi:hypothetical protein
MKTTMTTKQSGPILGLMLSLLLPQAGQCFYNPSTGKWLSRDPIEEDGGPNICAFAGNNAVGAADALGLWTTGGHEQIIDDWLKNRPNVVQCGCCKIKVKQLLKNASAQTDGYTSTGGFHWLFNLNLFNDHNYFHQQSVSTVAQHGMAMPGQTVEEAKEARDQFVNWNVAEADGLGGGANGCQARQDALKYIGYAFHSISDSASLSHSFQDWGGLGQSIITLDAITHVEHETKKTWNERWPQYWKDEVLAELNSRLLNALNQALQGCQGWKQSE